MRFAPLAFATALSCASCVAMDTVAVSSTGVTSCSAPLLRDGRCAARLASSVAQRALCGCSKLELNPDVSTDGFDSRVAAWAPKTGSGDIGANAGLSFPEAMDVGGSLVVGGGIEAGARLTVAKDLRIAGSLLRPNSTVIVSGDARIGGNVEVSSLAVAGTLTMPSTATTSGVITAGARETAPVSVAAPCQCEGIDVAAIVERHREDNDDATIALLPTTFAGFSGDATVVLPCGLFFLDGVSSTTEHGTLTIRASGRTVVFVRNGESPLKLEVAAGAELDLFVDGRLTLAAQAGDPSRPRALRLYANASIIDVGALTGFSGALYAPTSSLTSDAPQSLFGAVVVGSLIGGWDGKLDIHYDQALASVDDACP